ncbi:3-isopropylmalate dehydratase large subunit [Alkalicoccus chagannorensis]|uniref:3-isopropylmalate dehydratase large subunit n=1 Tax=Alkalicoccus chagannorensis TaxID=427072 RepID=UPI000424AF9C|nr:3-isopropylmalate dehydratase large subunit [Alkalicoccus chagannorensis]
MGRTLYEKIWEKHVVKHLEDQPSLLYIDLHLVHEVTSPQAFEGLRLKNRTVRRPDRTLATMDHNVPTTDRNEPLQDMVSQKQIDTLEKNCEEFSIPVFDLFHADQGIVHVIAPENGLTLPGQTIVCGDSHTSTHGAFGALAFGIGTSEVEHVLTTQCLKQYKSKTLAVNFNGSRPFGVEAKDIILGLIGKYGHDFATGYVIEFRGPVQEELTMEERMTICNMTIEMGGRAGLFAPDDVTFDYVQGKKYAPSGQAWEDAVQEWRTLYTDDDAVFDQEISLNVSELEPQVSWGTNPGMTTGISGHVPKEEEVEAADRNSFHKALEYMELKPGHRLQGTPVDVVFIGSCTNARIEDLRKAAAVVKGKKTDSRVHAMVVPGSMQVKKQAEEEGLDDIFLQSGFEWRNAGCSMCLGMNPDALKPGQRCASTSNRNFEGRQGSGGRTHLMSPEMAAAAALTGEITDVRRMLKEDAG